MYDLAKCLVDAWEGAIAQHLCDLSGCSNINEVLDLVQRLAMRGVPDSETVQAESVVLILIRDYIDVAIIVVIEGQVPVSPVS